MHEAEGTVPSCGAMRGRSMMRLVGDAKRDVRQGSAASLGSAQLLRASLRLFVGVLAAGVGEGGDRVRSRAAVTVASGAAGTCGWPAAGGADYAPQVSEPAAVVGWPLEPTGASIPPIRPRPGRAHTGEPRTRTLAAFALLLAGLGGTSLLQRAERDLSVRLLRRRWGIDARHHGGRWGQEAAPSPRGSRRSAPEYAAAEGGGCDLVSTSTLPSPQMQIK